MNAVIGVTWVLVSVLNWASLAVMLLGVIIFGRNLFLTSVRDREFDNLSPIVFKGPQAKLAMKVFGAGVVMQILSIVIAIAVPGRM